MVERANPEAEFITNLDLEEKIKNGRITTFTVTRENLPDYLNAAPDYLFNVANDDTEFRVDVIAWPDEYYVTEQIKPVNLKRRKIGQNDPPIINCVKSKSPVREGSVAISLKRPEGVTDDIAFNRARQQVEQRRLREEERTAKKKNDS